MEESMAGMGTERLLDILREWFLANPMLPVMTGFLLLRLYTTNRRRFSFLSIWLISQSLSSSS